MPSKSKSEALEVQIGVGGRPLNYRQTESQVDPQIPPGDAWMLNSPISHILPHSHTKLPNPHYSPTYEVPQASKLP